MTGILSTITGIKRLWDPIGTCIFEVVRELWVSLKLNLSLKRRMNCQSTDMGNDLQYWLDRIWCAIGSLRMSSELFLLQIILRRYCEMYFFQRPSTKSISIFIIEDRMNAGLLLDLQITSHLYTLSISIVTSLIVLLSRSENYGNSILSSDETESIGGPNNV